jgi:hypothetical protein
MSKPTVTYQGKTYTVLFPDLLRPLTKVERFSLADDIRAKGVLVPVVVDENNGIIDGINRLTIAAEESKVETVPFDVRPGLSAKAKRDLAFSLNVPRRHLTPAQQQEARQQRVGRVAEARRQNKSTRAIAEAEGVSEKQVREDIKKATAEGYAVEPEGGKVTGRDGKTRPAKKPPAPPKPEPKAAEEPQPTRSPKVEVVGRDPSRAQAEKKLLKAPLAYGHVAVEVEYSPTAADQKRQRRAAVAEEKLLDAAYAYYKSTVTVVVAKLPD